MSKFDYQAYDISARITAALVLICSCFFLLALRLWYLQVVNGEYFRWRSENNRIREVHVPAPRGMIFDRNGKVLVKNRPAFNIELVTEDSPNIKDTLAKLENIIGVTPGSLKFDPAAQRRRKPFEPKLVARDVSRDVLAKVVSHKFELPGVIIGITPAREYVYGIEAAHLLGYIREINKHQLSNPRYSRYLAGDLVGQYGLEAEFEDRLQGMRGLQRIEVDARGNRMSEFSFESERIGHDLHLTIDLEVQKTAYEALEGISGSAVAMNPNTGAIIAMASSPSFDPNLFVGDLSAAEWRDLVSGPQKKLSNRTTQGEYPPGSVFKVFMAVVALSEKVVTPNTRVNCPGYYYFGGRAFKCHKRGGHGSVNLYDAIVQSCDVYFYNLGATLSIDTIHDYMTRFGFGMRSGLALTSENPGLIPSTEWKRNYFRRPEDKKWYPGETLSVSIGQGAVTVTPLQAARALSTLVNGGKLLRPYVVEQVEGNDGTVLEKYEPQQTGSLQVPDSVLETVKKAMVGVVNDPRGTGHRAKLEMFPEIVVAGKTGTAQTASDQHYKSGGKFEDHAWFVSYAPADAPEIVVAVLAERAGHGGSVAAPVAKKIFESYFATKQIDNLKESEPQVKASESLN